MEDLLVYQNELLENLKKAERNYKKTPKDRIKRSYIETRIELLEALWKEFKDGHKSVILKVTEDEKENSYFEDDICEVFEELYINYKSMLKEALQPFLEASTSQPTVCSPQFGSNTDVRDFKNRGVNLPTIKIPTFTGKYEEWQTFYDLFSTLIHNNEYLSPVQKLHYLKSNLSGEPEALLRNFSTTEANYDAAWKQLQKRYNNKRLIGYAILKTLLSQKPIQTESAGLIKQLVDTTSTCLKALENIGLDSWDFIINYLVMSKLESESIKLWEQHITTSNDETVTWPELRDFLEARFRALEMLENTKVKSVQAKPTAKPKVFHSNVADKETRSEMKCALCSGEHYIYSCKKFSDMSAKDRQEFVQTKKLCFNCLAPSHSVSRCRQSACCKRCGRRHHSLLHFERDQKIEKSKEGDTATAGISNELTTGKPISVTNETQVISNFSSEQVQSNRVLLATAKVLVESRNGCKYIVRALLDQGSQASFVTEATVQLLNLKRKPVSGWVSGVGEKQTRIKYRVSFNVKSCHNPNKSVTVEAYVLRSLTTQLPSTYLGIPKWSDLRSLELADPGFATPGRIDILFGAEVYSDILVDGVRKDPMSNLLAQNTILGWVLSGKMSRETTSIERSFTSLHVQLKEDDMLKLFWELENEPNTIQKRFSKEEEKCEEYYKATTIRDKEGRYVVKLPLREENAGRQPVGLKEIAVKRLESLERKFAKNNKLQEDYHKVMNEYLNLNHMVQLHPADIENPKAIYLPHHGVVREDKDTTKLRVVFDASCKGVNNVSLNDNLLVGPKLQQDLRHILMRWRTHKICISADIVKMYRMVRVAEEDTNYQRLLWRPCPTEPIKHFKLERLTFGTACAPYLAVKSLQTLADDEKSTFPVAASITKSDFFMDDLLTGCETEEEAVSIYNDLNKLLNLGGFELQKWSSNNEYVLNYMGKHKRDDQELPLKVNSLVKVLGVSWNRTSDSFSYSLNLPDPNEKITKRQILSDVAKLYDPLGWVAPVVISAKIMIQKLWKLGMEWDDPVRGELLAEWLHIRQNLIHLKDVSIPRWLHCYPPTTIELHVFADASQAAYGAVVYARVVHEKKVYVNLITAKTKVAPVDKQVSIPRLELCGAVLATKLIFETSQVMNVPKEKLYAWTDSTIVLAWLKGGPSRWNTFVSNRVSDILNILDYEQWGHVPTDTNPADCASRGLQVPELLNKSLWWNGPTWLSARDLNMNLIEIEETQEEEKIRNVTALLSLKEDFIWNKFSNLSRMLRVMSYCRRWLKFKKGTNQCSKIITTEEITETLNICIKQTQGMEFKEEIKCLKFQGCVLKRSKLRNLCPLIDDKGILRVSGRIQSSDTGYDIQHPIILPTKSHLSRLIIIDAHQKTMHGGPQVMLNYLRSKYWIMSAKDQVKKCYRECIICRRYSRNNSVQLMGQLPEVRVKPSRPFRSAGVDYAGPINIRFSPGRGAKAYKGYICLFICMVTRAIHLEAVTDLTSKGFIAAFRRFTARRGHCQDLYSDNGTNFVGADKQLRDLFDKAKSSLPSEIAELLTKERTTWHFIPPHAPNFGGLWEAGVRSTKTHLKRVIGDCTLTYEELSTVLAQVEACLNSRPLTLLSNDPNDPLPLTPGHFLVGEPLLNLADENDTLCKNITNLERWRLVQKIVNDFWNRWHREYLVNLNKRYKWNTKQPDPEIDDVVVLKEDNIPPSKWLLGRIVEKHVGPDNLTRVVSVRCKNNILKRPVHKICVLTK